MVKLFSAGSILSAIISAGILYSSPIIPHPNDSVVFLENEPPMDGIIYNDVLSLPVRRFNSTQSAGESCPQPEANFRLAYGLGFLYIIIEYNSESITVRDRAYQNGDGIIVTIAKPKQNNERADEFYVLGFSPDDNPANIKARKFIWYRNMELSFQPLKETKFCWTIINSKVYFQALIYWKEIYPYHPAFDEGIGFNLCLVKACGENDKLYYFNVNDNKIQSEQSTREYEILKFSKPHELTLPQLYCILSRNYLSKNDELSLIACCVGKPSCVVTLAVSVTADDNSYSQSDEYALFNTKGCTKIYYDIPVNKLPFKNYTLSWKAGAYSFGKIKFTLLPEFNYEKLNGEIDKAKEKICNGSYSTMRFLLDDVAARYKKLKIYESCPDILKDLTDLNVFTGCAAKNVDTLTRKEGVFRRGFKSGYDSTYRPYTIRIPAKFNIYNKYPLIVYLHGSGDDDRAALKLKSLTKGSFIELYPNGRGTSNAYCTPESQIDITEAVNDVINNYPVDTENIILAGFSMGGYGVYRTYYDHPEIYKGLAVFSGHPNLANMWLGEGYPDFLQDKYLKKFSGVKIFIFHGTDDLNSPFELTRELAEKLKAAGADVEFVTESTGHTLPSDNSLKLFQNWLEGIASLKQQ